MSYSIFNKTEEFPEYLLKGLDDQINSTTRVSVPGTKDSTRIYPGCADAVFSSVLGLEHGASYDIQTVASEDGMAAYCMGPVNPMGGRTVVITEIDRISKEIRGSIVKLPDRTKLPLDLASSSFVSNGIPASTAVYALLLEWFWHEDTPLNHIRALITSYRENLPGLAANVGSMQDVKDTLALFCSRLYIHYNKRSFRAPATGKLKPVETNRLSPDETVKEDVEILSEEEDTVDYSLHLDFPEEVQPFIPKVPEWATIPKWVKDAAFMIKVGGIRNLYLTGEAGTGKTLGTELLCALLEVPYYKVTCNEDTEIFDLMGQLMPVTDDSVLGSELLDSITEDQILFETEKVAEMIGANGTDIKSVIRALSTSGNIQYHYVKTGAVLAYQYGGICEVQEAKVVRKAGTLVGMNNMLEVGENKSITLPTGELIDKNQFSMFVFTSNEAYEGCRPMNQSVLSRMQVNIHVDLPEVEVMADRVMKKTGFSDRKRMERMVNIVRDIHEYCEKQEITDGVCGMRELESWAQLLQGAQMAGFALTDAVMKTYGEIAVLNKVSQQREYIEEVRTSIWNAKL